MHELENQKSYKLPIDQSSVLSVWKEFCSLVPDEETSRELIFEALNAVREFICEFCDSSEFKRMKEKRLIFCCSCRNQIWYTAGTFFARAKYIRPYLAGFYFFSKGVLVNSVQFHKLTGLAQSSAWEILRKVSMALEVGYSANFEEVQVSQFIVALGKRSSLTPIGPGIKHEIELSEAAKVNEEQGSVSSFCKKSTELSEISKLNTFSKKQMSVIDLVELKPTHFENLLQKSQLPAEQLMAILTVFEIYGLVSRVNESSYVLNRDALRIESSHQGKVSEATGEFIKTCAGVLLDVYRGISRKYLQQYVELVNWLMRGRRLRSDHQIKRRSLNRFKIRLRSKMSSNRLRKIHRAKRKKWLSILIDICLQKESICYLNIRKYVTPPTVKIYMHV